MYEWNDVNEGYVGSRVPSPPYSSVKGVKGVKGTCGCGGYCGHQGIEPFSADKLSLQWTTEFPTETLETPPRYYWPIPVRQSIAG